MSYKSQRMVVSIIGTLGLLIAYIIYGLNKSAAGEAPLSSWALGMLIFIGGGIAGMILIMVLFHIGYSIGIASKERKNEQTVERVVTSLAVEDEMEKLINWKSSHVGYFLSGLGFVAALVALALGASAVFALHCLAASFLLGMLVAAVLSIYWYEKGV